MIKIITTEDKYGYDIHSLFKAFFSSEDVKVIVSSDGKYEADEGDKIYDIDVSVSKNDLKKNIYRMLSLETRTSVGESYGYKAYTNRYESHRTGHER